jgi:hypothetical protein
MLMADVHAEQLMRSIEPDIRHSLSPAQEAAIRAAATRNPWVDHPVDLRLSLPLPFGRIYLTLLAGRERRSAARRRSERHPLDSLGNVCFAAGATVMLAALAFSAATLLGLI